MPYPLRIEYPALSRAQLQLIADRHGNDPVVKRLLMEVRALQNIARRAHQVAEAAGPGSRCDAFGIAVEALHRELAVETWFQEDRAEREAYRSRLMASDESPYPEHGVRHKRK